MQPYSSKEWREFRATIIRLDDGRCVRCGRGQSDGAILHVHHKSYKAGRLPWEYPLDQCETLCAGCHAAHHGKIPPKIGWDFAGHDDLGELIGECEVCGTDIRYVFLVSHPNWPSLEVGEICCDHLTCTEIASNHMDSVRRYNDRRKRFVGSSRWKQVRIGHEYIHQEHILVEVRRFPPGFQLRMNGKRGRQMFPNVIAAKAQAFDVIESKEHAEFVRRIRKRPAPLNLVLRLP